ncbi:universal stress protein [Gorillibacterium massiliense]|uniref:universal stress protein n=1 Tax=Gorillibacterium massiliense TaxID=1280390 RepID=UPI0004ADEEE1
MTKYAKELAAHNVPYEMVLLEGNPKHQLVKKFSALDETDLVICGATGLNRAGHILLGSVSDNIVRNSNCDVLVVRTNENANDEPGTL